MRATTRQVRDGEFAQEFGRVIRERRRVLGLTLQQLGTLAGIDVSQLSKVERGIGATALATLERIAFELGLTLRLVGRPGRRSSRNPAHHGS